MEKRGNDKKEPAIVNQVRLRDPRRLAQRGKGRQEVETETSKEAGSPIIILLPAAQLMTAKPICLRPQRVRAICDLSLSLALPLSSRLFLLSEPAAAYSSKPYNFYNVARILPSGFRSPDVHSVLDTTDSRGSCQNELHR